MNKQIEIARKKGEIDQNAVKQFNNLFGRLNEIFPNEKPSLVHGDLWNGNYLVDQEGNVCLIDPAVYYGFREMDIAMTKLFEGFLPAFYESYIDEYPLEKGWQERVDICNLYPLMVHVNLFGGGYAMQVESILRRF